jgi:O-acetylhomoserine (thiol)-lyase
MAAITYAIQTIAEPATTSSRPHLYGGTYNLFAHTLPQQGIEVRFADPRDPASFEALIDGAPRPSSANRSATRWATSPTSRALAEIAHKHGVPLIVDNTVPSPTCAARSSTAPTSSCTR